MGTIYRNGVPFVGSGGAGGVEMTQAEYDLLPTSEKMNGAIYFITDGDVSYPSASQMRYDNTESQIPATTVQGAIDENRIEINDLKAGLTKTLLYEGYCAAGSSVVVNGLSDSRVLLFEFNVNPETSSSRSRAFVAGDGVSYYTVNVGGTVGYARIELASATNTVNFLATSVSGYCIRRISRVL